MAHTFKKVFGNNILKEEHFNALIQISFITEIVNITKSTTGNLCNLIHVIIILLLTSLDLKT